jgi:hypothetical protein
MGHFRAADGRGGLLLEPPRAEDQAIEITHIVSYQFALGLALQIGTKNSLSSGSGRIQ